MSHWIYLIPATTALIVFARQSLSSNHDMIMVTASLLLFLRLPSGRNHLLSPSVLT